MNNYITNLKQYNDFVIRIKGIEKIQRVIEIKVSQISGIKIFAMIFTMFFISGLSAFGQTPDIILDGSTYIGPNNSCSASIDLRSDKKGILINRVNLTSTTDNSTVPLLCHTMLVYNLNTQSNITPGFYWWDALATIPHWVSLGSGAGAGGDPWILTGNSNTFTDYGNNLLGTLLGTNMPLNFIVNGQRAGRIEFDPNTANTFFGYKTGNVNTGVGNTATGYLALTNNERGSINTATGNSALLSNTTGNLNTAVGNSALQSNLTGILNTAVGHGALQSNIANSNTAIGALSLFNNTTGTNNTANGIAALQSNSTGNKNTSIGHSSLIKNTTGSNNVASGYQALSENTTGVSNSAYGSFSLLNNVGSNNTAAGTNSLLSNTSGGNNTATGINAMRSNTTGSQSTATGEGALFSNNASFNTATGAHSLNDNTTGTNNTADGVASLQSNITGSRNSALGRGALFNSGGNDNIGVGFQSGLNVSTASNVITIGSNLQGVNTSNTTYMANIWGTSVVAGVNGGGAAVLQVVVNSDGQLGTISAPSNSSDTDDWKLIGNSNTTTDYTNNLLGTLNGTSMPLNFIVDGQRAGRIELAPNTANTFFGFKTGNVNTGSANSATGYLALTSNTTGFANTANGYFALKSNISGNYNTAIGNIALRDNIDGNDNTALGDETLTKNTNGSNNTATGGSSLSANTIGKENTATGNFTLRSNISGNENTANGVSALQNNSTGNQNTSIGHSSLIKNTTGSNNVASGYQALSENTGGYENTALGNKALYYNSTGSNNIAIGSNSGLNVTTGSNIIVIGAGLFGQNQPDYRTYIENIYGTPVSGTLIGAPLSVVVNSNGLLGTIPTPGTGTDANWKILGNNNTSEGTNFLGTTNQQYLDFRVNNKMSGHIDWDITKGNTFFGYSAGIVTTGTHNTATGFLALTTNTTGEYNTANGNSALQSNATGSWNTAVGQGALALNTESSNTATGALSLFNNTKGIENTANGVSALQNNVIGSRNSALGREALLNSTGDNNIGIGYKSGTAVTTASKMICIGDNIAGDNVGSHTYIANIHGTTVPGSPLTVVVNSNGLLGTISATTSLSDDWLLVGNNPSNSNINANSFLGFPTGTCLPLNFKVNGILSGHIECGLPANTSFGYNAGSSITSGFATVAIGDEALMMNTSGDNNTAAGFHALRVNLIGKSNTAVGSNALTNSTGSNNIAIGSGSGSAVTTANNMICIGNSIAGDNNGNHTFIANIHGTTVPGTATGGALSVVVNSNGLLGTKASTFAFTHYIGEVFDCGVIFYLFRDASGIEHGLIVSPTDVSSSFVWSNPANNTTGATSPWDGSGINPGNSFKVQQNTTSGAAQQCLGYSAGSCTTGWYLPSMDELSLLFDASYIINRTLGSSGQLANAFYWSSNEFSSTEGVMRGFGTLGGAPGTDLKSNSHSVRAIRAF